MSRSSQASASATVSTDGASGSAGRSTMITGSDSARAASSLAEAPAPPEFLVTITSIACASSSARLVVDVERSARGDQLDTRRQIFRRGRLDAPHNIEDVAALLGKARAPCGRW